MDVAAESPLHILNRRWFYNCYIYVIDISILYEYTLIICNNRYTCK
jgi:hypothetical protein